MFAEHFAPYFPMNTVNQVDFEIMKVHLANHIKYLTDLVNQNF